MSVKHQVQDGRRVEELQKWNESEKTQTPRLRAPVDTPGETGVRRPDGRKPEAVEGAGGGLWWCNGRRERKKETQKDMWAKLREIWF